MLLLCVFLPATGVLAGCTANPAPVTIDNEFFAEVYDLQISRTDTVWIVSDQGIAQFDGSSWSVVAPHGNYERLAIAPDNVLWTHTTTQIIRFDDGARQVYTPTLDAPIREIHGLDFSSDGKIWAGVIPNDDTGSLISLVWSPDYSEWYRAPEVEVFQDYLKNCLQDEWQYIHFDFIGLDGKERPWVSMSRPVYGKTLAYLDEETWRDTSVNRIAFLPDGSHWAIIAGWWCQKPTLTWDDAGICYYPDVGNRQCYMYGQLVRLGSTCTGYPPLSAVTIPPTNDSEFSFPSPLSKERITCFATEADGTLWAITKSKNLLRFDGTTWESRQAELREQECRDMAISSQGDIWIVTSQGVGRIAFH